MAIAKRIITRMVLLAIVITPYGPGLAIEAPQELPPIDPNVLELVQKHPSLVNQILVDTASYEAASTTSSGTKSVGQQSSQNEQTTLRVLQLGIFEERTAQQMSLTVNGQPLPK